MPVDLRCIRIKGRARTYDNLDRDDLIDEYIGCLDYEERTELLFDLIKDSDKECFAPEWMRNVLEDMDRENGQ